MSQIIGVVYPVPEKLVNRLLHEKRNVFVKYLPRTTNLRIAPRNKVFFYASQDSKEIAGEGVIQLMEFLTPFEVLEKYKEKVFLDKDELLEYATREPGRELTKKLLVLVMSNVKAYSPRLKWTKPITMAGQYLTKEEYLKLRKIE
jgi:hypothetical protein